MKVENAQRNASMSEAEVVQLFCIPTNLEKIMFHLPDIIFFKSLAAWDYLPNYASTCCTQFGQKTLDASLVIWLFNRSECGMAMFHTKWPATGPTDWFFFFALAQFFTHQWKVMKVVGQSKQTAPFAAAFLKGTVKRQMRSEYWWLPIYMNGTQLRTVRSEASFFMSGYHMTSRNCWSGNPAINRWL